MPIFQKITGLMLNVSVDESKFFFDKKLDSGEKEPISDVVFAVSDAVVEESIGDVVPRNAKEALADTDWREAMKNEFE